MGWLFEYYMWTSSAYSAYRRWNVLLELESTQQNGQLSEEFQVELSKNYGIAFMGWLLLNVGNMGTHGRRQLFYMTFTNRYFGLSRDGINVLAQYGYGVTLDMFDKMFKATELASLDKIRFNFLYTIF